jgi:hypothetical protein
MFSIVFASLTLSLAFAAVGFEFPHVQSLMLVGACMACTAFCGSFEAWSAQATVRLGTTKAKIADDGSD